MRRHGEGLGVDAVATVIQRLAVLLSAGVPPVSAWRYLAEAAQSAPAPPGGAAGVSGATAAGRSPPQWPEADVQPVLAAAVAASEGRDVAEALASAAVGLPPPIAGAWSGLAAAWQVATAAGAPLAATLRSLADSFRDLGQTQRDVAVALAGPAATARLVLALPAVGVLFGLGLGFDTLRILFATGPGLLCLAGGALLTWAGRRWNTALVRRARPTLVTPGLAIDLTAVAMSGGASVARARSLVQAAAERHSLQQEAAAIGAVIALAERAGIPAAELLRSEADQVRRTARSDAQRAAATLAVKLMLPLAVCILPAFLLVGVAPLLMALLSSTLAPG